MKINEKYFKPSGPILSPIIFAINSYVDSNIDWLLEGIIEDLFNPKNINKIIKITVESIASEELVKDISYPRASIGMIFFISNCDRGLANFHLLI